MNNTTLSPQEEEVRPLSPSRSALQERAAEAVRLRGRLVAKDEAAGEEEARSIRLAQTAQARVDAQDRVRAVLERVQRRAHEHAVGAYEKLLGALLEDVLGPGREVVMDLHTERGGPALDVFIRKPNISEQALEERAFARGRPASVVSDEVPEAPLEDALNGTGGSVTNLLSTGLRLVALLRSEQRRFLVLDESDCWIKPDLIPRYAAVVAQMAGELGVQILMISHHEESLFSGSIPHRLVLSRPGSGPLSAQWSPSSEIPVWSDEQSGIRSITLRNVQSHQNTHVPLAPGVTLLQGGNDLGKSAIVAALRAVFLGEGHDSMIRHYTDEAEVVIDLGEEKLLSWVRRRKGKRKAAYTLRRTDGTIIHDSEGVKVPDWLLPCTGIGMTDDLDIQIGRQQTPVFLLADTATVRAKALAVGEESAHIQKMMLLDRQALQEARSTLKRESWQLEHIRRRRLALKPLRESDGLSENTWDKDARRREADLASMRDLVERWVSAVRQHKALLLDASPVPEEAPRLRAHTLGGLLTHWRGVKATLGALSPIHSSEGVGEMPVARGAGVLEVVSRWATAQKKTEILAFTKDEPGFDTSMPVARTGSMREVIRGWRQCGHKANLLREIVSRPPLPSLPTPGEQSGRASELAGEWKHAKNNKEKARKGQKAAELVLEDLPTCPTCGQVWSDGAHAHTDTTPSKPTSMEATS